MSDSYIARKHIKKQTWLIHDNGGRPFQVIATSRNIIILAEDFECGSSSDDDEELESSYTFFIQSIDNFKGYWYGFDSSKNKMHGNSLLIKLHDHKYMYIGSEIYTFVTKDKIVDYVSPVGNSDVPY